jgi:hypothetical protein
MHNVQQKASSSPPSAFTFEQVAAGIRSDLDHLAQIFALFEEGSSDEQRGAVTRAKSAIARGIELAQQLSNCGDVEREAHRSS